MKIYFAGSIRGGREDKDLYLEIINYLKEFGEVLTEHIGKTTLSEMGEHEVTEEYIYNRDIQWLEEADIVVAEVTQVSLGVGYEIGYTENKKPVICLYRPQDGKRLSAMIAGNPKLKVIQYNNLEELKPKLKEILEK